MEYGSQDRNNDEMFQGLLQVIREQLPRIVDILAPEIIELFKGKVDSYNTTSSTSNSMNNKLEAEFNAFRNNNKTYIEEQLREREEKYYTLARYEHYLDLWTECLEEEPVYVPKKYRNDKFYVTSNAELISVNRSELQRFQSQCEIFRLRRDNITAEIFAIDKAIVDMITRSNLSPEVTQKATERWNKLINEDIARVDAKWKKKIAGVRESYIKDQDYVMSNSRIRISNTRSNGQQLHQQQQQQEQQQQLQFHSKRISSSRGLFNQGFQTVNNNRFSAPTIPTFSAATATAARFPVLPATTHTSSVPRQPPPPPGIAEPGILAVPPPTTEENSLSNMSTPLSTTVGNHTESPPTTVFSNNNNITNTPSGGARPRTEDVSKNGRGQSVYNLRS